MSDLPAPARVTAMHRETHDTWTLRLERSGEALPAFAPGQFAMLYAFGAGEIPISVSAVDDAGAALVHTVRAVGATTRALCASEPGDVLGVRGPFGTCWPLAATEGRDVVLVAGGIGLAPLRPVVHALVAHPERYGRVSVLIGGRTPAELPYAEEIESWRVRSGVSVEVTVDAAPEGWSGRVGVVTRLIPGAAFDPRRTVAMMCGPEVMMRFAAGALRDRGLADDAIWVSLERSMKCAVGHCGHCQLGPVFVCKDGPVFRADAVERLLRVPEL
jgi:NAD(P)H-flavin reductase